jgi:hypothetical protein
MPESSSSSGSSTAGSNPHERKVGITDMCLAAGIHHGKTKNIQPIVSTTCANPTPRTPRQDPYPESERGCLGLKTRQPFFSRRFCAKTYRPLDAVTLEKSGGRPWGRSRTRSQFERDGVGPHKPPILSVPGSPGNLACHVGQACCLPSVAEVLSAQSVSRPQRYAVNIKAKNPLAPPVA